MKKWGRGYSLILCISRLFRLVRVDMFCCMVALQLRWCHCCYAFRIFRVQYSLVKISWWEIFFILSSHINQLPEEYLKYATTCPSDRPTFYQLMLTSQQKLCIKKKFIVLSPSFCTSRRYIYRGSGIVAPLILNVGPCCSWVASYTHRYF